MDEIYRSQFRLPYPLYEAIKAAADKNHRSVNSELVDRLEITIALDNILQALHFSGFQDAPALIPKLISENAELYDTRETFRKQIRDEFSKMLEARLDLLESRLLSLPDSSFGKSLKKT